jgi:photosystem II stability/assembly factor-like uncharacterized protein
MSISRGRSLCGVSVLALTLSAAFVMNFYSVAIAQEKYPSNLYSGLRWRNIGPFRAGRVNAVTGVIGQPSVYYFGSVGGGVWKTINSGRTWTPIFDSERVASIGAIAVAPSNPNVIYVGTGEADMRDSISFGNGVYKSIDAGKTWKHLGLENSRQIGRIIVDPKNPDLAYIAVLGHVYGPHPDRGVYRTKDGGATWQKVLYKNEDLGAIDLAFDPVNSQIIYASMWNVRRPPWFIYAPANGPGAGIFKSSDAGNTWTQLTNGLPSEGVGRIGLAVSPTNRNRIYAIVDAKEGGLFSSSDAGATWTKVSADNRIWGRGWYFNKVTADPKDPDTVFVQNTSIYKSTNGGKNWTAIKGAPGGDDYHQLWINPDDPKRMISGSDQGCIVTEDGAITWSSWYNQSTAQLYHVAADNRFPYWLTGAQQDSGAIGVPSRSNHSEISNHDWTGVCAGGESGYTAPDPLHPEILFGDIVERCDLVTGATQNVSPERGASGGPFRHAWTQPLVFSAADKHALYFANQYVYKTTNGGESWTQISQDLTREEPGAPSNLNEAAAADVPPTTTAAKRLGVIYTIAPSPLRAPMIWIGTDDGYFQLTNDDGKTWTNVTPPQVTAWSKVVMMEASHFDVDEAYAAVERHQLEDYEPYIYRTRDSGKTWAAITTGLPAGVYVQTVKEDPHRRGLLFAGTELGAYVSFDDGDHWQSLQLNLPHVSVRDLVIHRDDLIVATHGRGFWVLDNITALRQIDAEMSKSNAFLFKPAIAINVVPGSDNGTPQPRDEALAENPPFGAVIDYYLKSAANGSVTLEIMDPAGEVIRRYSSDERPTPVDPNTLNIPAFWRPTPEPLSAASGMHRWVWDLQPTPPPATQRRQGGGGGGGGGGFGFNRATVLPGRYTVRLTVDGQSLTQPLIVEPDPRSK